MLLLQKIRQIKKELWESKDHGDGSEEKDWRDQIEEDEELESETMKLKEELPQEGAKFQKMTKTSKTETPST